MAPRSRTTTTPRALQQNTSRKSNDKIPPKKDTRKRKVSDAGVLVATKKQKPDTTPSSNSTRVRPSKPQAAVRALSTIPRKSRPSVTTVPSSAKDDKIQTRGTQKTEIVNEPHCALCKEGYSYYEETLKPCSYCMELYHLRRCLKYKPKAAANYEKSRYWKCARCVTCKKCDDFVNDPENVECWSCGSAWHGTCAPRGRKVCDEFDSEWYCSRCARKPSINLQRDSATPEPISEGTSTTTSPPVVQKSIEFQEESQSPKVANGLVSWDELLEERNALHDKLAEKAGLARSPVKNVASREGSPKKRIASPSKVVLRSPKKELSDDVCLLTDFDEKLYQDAVAESEKLKANDVENKMVDGDRWVSFGDGVAMRSVTDYIYFDDEPQMSTSNTVYICKFCLVACTDADTLAIHLNNCTCYYPPGNEIYRDGKLSFFEVFGSKQKYYCRNLCRMARMFISSKTVHHEVETFIFYILCEITTSGYEIAGFFSKEKNPSKNNNLSCLLTLPKVQRMGYGRLLIDLSYALSRRELKIGCPEHPLSDLGVLAYRGYWRSSILCYLRSLKAGQQVNIKDISLSTRIHPIDIVNMLLKDRLMVHEFQQFKIKIGKRALKYPLSMTRRRCIKMDKLMWQPDPESLKGLDPSKLNFYV